MGCFHILTAVNELQLTWACRCFLEILFSVPFSEVSLLGAVVITVLILWRTRVLFSTVAALLCVPPQHAGVLISSCSCQAPGYFLGGCYIWNGRLKRHKVMGLVMVLIWISPIIIGTQITFQVFWKGKDLIPSCSTQCLLSSGILLYRKSLRGWGPWTWPWAKSMGRRSWGAGRRISVVSGKMRQNHMALRLPCGTICPVSGFPVFP